MGIQRYPSVTPVMSEESTRQTEKKTMFAHVCASLLLAGLVPMRVNATKKAIPFDNRILRDKVVDRAFMDGINWQGMHSGRFLRFAEANGLSKDECECSEGFVDEVLCMVCETQWTQRQFYALLKESGWSMGSVCDRKGRAYVDHRILCQKARRAIDQEIAAIRTPSDVPVMVRIIQKRLLPVGWKGIVDHLVWIGYMEHKLRKKFNLPVPDEPAPLTMESIWAGSTETAEAFVRGTLDENEESLGELKWNVPEINAILDKKSRRRLSAENVLPRLLEGEQ